MLASGSYDVRRPYTRMEQKEDQRNYAVAVQMIPKLSSMQPSRIEQIVKIAEVNPKTGEKSHQYF
jgi:hypothetical protein